MNDIEKPEDFDVFDDLIESFDVDRDLALKFFLVFSWFEYLLKNADYFQDRGYIRIDWTRFGNELDSRFNANKTPELKKAVDFLMEEPPSNQRVTDGENITWESVSPPERASTELARILFRVTTVRNNFFHGGKFLEIRERDYKLMGSCLVVLGECIHLHGDLNYIYNKQIEEVED